MTTRAPWMDTINRKTWSDPATVDWFRHLDGWTDPGEQAALEHVAAEARGKPILDLGVGGGRTVPLMRAISHDYVGLDYTAELVAACNVRYPDVRVVHGDARDLSRFGDGSFQLVAFSFNGIDAVDHEGRRTILEEAYRVLRPGGVFFFSAHNSDGPGNGEKLSFGVYPTRNPIKLAWRVAQATLRAGRTLQNRMQYGKLGFDAEGYSIKNAAAHDHGIVIHYTSMAAQLRDLERVGFRPGTPVYSSETGKLVTQDDDVSQAWWLHFLARK